MTEPHLITIHETSSRHLRASGVDVLLTIAGQSFFTGNEAFNKAVEVANCITGLKNAGVTGDQVFLQNVSVAVNSGIISKSTSAKYHIAVKLPTLDALCSVLTVVASQKHIEATTLRWQYSDVETTKHELLQSAVKAARATAEAIAASLQTHVLAVHRLAYRFGEPDRLNRIMEPSWSKGDDDLMLSAGKIDLAFNHSTDLTVNVVAEFAIEKLNGKRPGD